MEVFFMARPEKEAQVSLIAEKLQSAKTAVLTDYRGLSVAQLQELRSTLRPANVEYRVVKNTLARRAVADAGQDTGLQELFTGPVAIAFGYDDLGAPVRLLTEWARQARLPLDLKGGLVEGRVMNAAEIRQIGDLPPRDVLIAQLLGTLQTPLSQLASAIQSSVQELVGLLEARREQLEGTAAPAA
jgi:large subunit ribosomal protein L10